MVIPGDCHWLLTPTKQRVSTRSSRTTQKLFDAAGPADARHRVGTPPRTWLGGLGTGSRRPGGWRAAGARARVTAVDIAGECRAHDALKRAHPPAGGYVRGRGDLTAGGARTDVRPCGQQSPYGRRRDRRGPAIPARAGTTGTDRAVAFPWSASATRHGTALAHRWRASC